MHELLNNINPDMRDMMLEAHKEGVEDFKKDLAYISSKIGKDHSLCQKMATSLEAMESLSEEEVLLICLLSEKRELEEQTGMYGSQTAEA